MFGGGGGGGGGFWRDITRSSSVTVTEGVECDQTLRLHIAPGVRVVSKPVRSTRTGDSIIVGFLPLPIYFDFRSHTRESEEALLV